MKAPRRGEELEVCRVRKNADEAILFRLRELNDELCADIRVHYEAADGTWRPTRRGICFRVEELGAAVQDGLAQLRAAAANWPPADRPTGKDGPTANEPTDLPEPEEAPL